MVRLGSIVMHVSEIGRAVEFWGGALEEQYELVHRDHNSATFFPRTKPGVVFQLTERNQMHLDLNTDSLEENAAEIKRLESLGARRVDWPYRPDVPVMADPDGNIFCVLTQAVDPVIGTDRTDGLRVDEYPMVVTWLMIGECRATFDGPPDCTVQVGDTDVQMLGGGLLSNNAGPDRSSKVGVVLEAQCQSCDIARRANQCIPTIGRAPGRGGSSRI